MTAKQRITAVLSKKTTSEIPVAPHWWGLYKFQHYGIIKGYEDEEAAWSSNAETTAEIDTRFYQEFQPDWFHLTSLPAHYPDNPKKWQAIGELAEQVRRLESHAVIDEYFDLLYRSPQEIIAGQEFAHLPILRKKNGDDVFLAINEGITIGAVLDPHGIIGFESGLIALLERPELMEHILQRVYANTLERVRAAKLLGADCYISSETYCSADIISPALYREHIFPYQQRFFADIKKLGISPIGYFTGNILPMLPQIKQLDLDGLMIEESKKGFALDVSEILHHLEKTMALFGNLDSVYTLQLGTAEEVRRATEQMLNEAADYPFIMANGCPISFDTPAENLHTMVQTARKFHFKPQLKIETLRK